MAVVSRDGFTYAAPPTSGAAPYTATDNTRTVLNMESRGSPAAGDKIEFTLHFSTGDVTFRARWSTTTTLLLERVSTIPGTSNGTATLQTFTGTSTNKPRTDGDLVRMFVTVNRGAVNALTALTFAWSGRGASSPAVTNTFNVDGELTPTGADFALTGSSFRNRPDIEGATPDGDGDAGLAVGTYTRVYTTGDEATSLPRRQPFGVSADGDAEPQMQSFDDMLYTLTGVVASGNYTVRAWPTLITGEFGEPIIGIRCSGERDFFTGTNTFNGYMLYGFPFGDGTGATLQLYKFTPDGVDAMDFADVPDLDDGVPHEWELQADGDHFYIRVDGLDLFDVLDTGTTILTGDPGLSGVRSGRDESGVHFTAWEIDEGGGAPPPPTPSANPCVTVRSLDAFSGPAVSDINGRTPDGDGVPEHATGTWTGGDGSDVIAIDGDGSAVKMQVTPTAYRLPGITGLGNDYCVRAIPRWPTRVDPGEPGAPGTVPYWGPWRYRIWGGDTATVLIEQGLVADILGTHTFADHLTITGLTAYPNGQPHSFTFHNGGTFGAATDFRAIEFYSTPYLADSGAHAWALTMDFEMTTGPEVETSPDPPYGFFSALGGDYEINNVRQGFFLPGPQNVGPSHYYPPFYFPNGNPGTQTINGSSAGSAPPFDLRWEDGAAGGVYDITLSELKVDDTATLDFGIPPGCLPPYTGTWTYRISGHNGNPSTPAAIAPVAGLVSDLVGDHTIAGLTLNNFTVWPTGQPKSFDWHCHDAPITDVEDDPFRAIEFFTTAHLGSSGTHHFPAPLISWSNGDPTPAPADTGDSIGFYQVGGVVTPSVVYAFGPTHASPQPDPTGSETVTGATLSVMLRLETEWSVAERLLSNIAAITVDDPVAGTYEPFVLCLPPGTIYPVAAFVEVRSRQSASEDTCYGLRMAYDPDAANTLTLFERSAGVETRLWSDLTTIDFDTEYLPCLRTKGTVLVVEMAGIALQSFDVATDLAEETAALVTDHATGDPALGMHDSGGDGQSIKVSQAIVLADPCTGTDPQNPYPDPPTVPPISAGASAVMKEGLWRSVLGPGPTVPSSQITVMANGLQRTLVGRWKMKQGLWRPVITLETEGPPPPNTDAPIYHDPCLILNPDVNLPPIGDVVPIPSVAGRSFGMGPMPVTLFGDVLNASQRPVGSWTEAELAICYDRGATIFGATGGYDKFIAGGYYRQTLMDDWIRMICLTYGDVLMDGQSRGTFGGMIPLDDFKVQRLWPTSPGTGGGDGHGLSNAEVVRIIAVWHSYLPDLVVGVRERPTLAGSGYAGATLYVAQYPGPYAVGKQIGDAITVSDFRSFRDTELAHAAGFGPDVVVNLQPNFLHAGNVAGYSIGDSWPNPYMTPDQLIVCADGWYADGGGAYVSRIYSSTGFMYRPEYVALTGMWDALTYHHNSIMSLPPL